MNGSSKTQNMIMNSNFAAKDRTTRHRVFEIEPTVITKKRAMSTISGLVRIAITIAAAIALRKRPVGENFVRTFRPSLNGNRNLLIVNSTTYSVYTKTSV